MKTRNVKDVTLNIVKTLLLPMIVYFVFLLISGGTFGSLQSLESVAINAVQPIIMAWGLMFILGAGMWDFSSGAQIYFTAMMSTQIVNALNLGPVMMLLVLIVVNVALRVIVAVIYNALRAPSMIVTLALCMIFESLCKMVYGTGAILKSDTAVELARSPWCFILLAVVLIVTVILWHYTRFAFNVRAIGAGERVARTIGLNQKVIRFKVFLVEGIFLGCAGAIFLASRGSIFAPANLASFTMVFDALMAVFIGTALEKYSNRIIGVAIGAIVMRMLFSGLLASGVNSAWQTAITGIFMALFIGFSVNQQRLSKYFAGKKRAQAANEEYTAQLGNK